MNIDGVIGINDLHLFLALFDDDAIIFGNNTKSLQSIPNDLEQYSITCNSNLKLNIITTKVMIFENSSLL